MSDKRTNRIDLRISDSELEQLRLKLKRSHISSMSEYIRRMALEGYIINVDMSVLKDAVFQLKRIGTGINQIAKVANSTGMVYEKDISDIRRAQEETWKVMSSVLEKVSDLM